MINVFYVSNPQTIMSAPHSGHCRGCKEQVQRFLSALYSDCRVNHAFSWPAKVQDYEHTVIGDTLKKIHVALGELRGYRDFAKSAQVPPCDYYVSNPPFILEFDESQHFSRLRWLSLTLYPAAFRAGFPLSRWRELCFEINAEDDDPPDRDERRAWYDVLRDLVPTVHGFCPTVRLYAGEFAWCSLDCASAKDRAIFCSILQGRLPDVSIGK
jgi:hypothetical protein